MFFSSLKISVFSVRFDQIQICLVKQDLVAFVDFVEDFSKSEELGSNF